MADPATQFAGQILNDDALAEAPTENEQAATPVAPVNNDAAVTPQTALGGEEAALPADATATPVDDAARLEDVRERLKRTGGYNNSSVNAVFRAAEIFNAAAPDSRKVSEMMLGLVWACEGHPRFLLHLTADQQFYIDRLAAITGHDATSEARRRAVKISAVGVWNFGLDDIFILRGAEQSDPAAYDWDVATARWRKNLSRFAGWTKNIPFENATPGGPDNVTPVSLDIPFDEDDAVGFLVAAASRFTTQVWKLPSELEARGYRLNLPNIEQLSDAEPVLAYATYQTSAAKAAAYFEVGVFARDFCNAVSDSVILSGKEVYLKPIIECVNRWLPKLKNESNVEGNIGLGWGVKTLLLNPDGVAALRAVTRKDWATIPDEENLSAEERRLLESVLHTWEEYALYVSAHFTHLSPGEFLGRGTLDSEATKLINTDEAYGFGLQNIATRFVRVNPGTPLGTTKPEREAN